MQERPTWSAEHVRKVAEKFRDHWCSLSGAKARKTDWLAVWRNWVRNEEGNAPPGAPPVTENPHQAKACCICGQPWSKQISGAYYCQEHDQHSPRDAA